MAYDIIYLLTAIWLSPGGRSTVHIYTQKLRRTIQNNQYREQNNNFGRMRAVPCLGSGRPLQLSPKHLKSSREYYRSLVKFYPYSTRFGLLVSLPEALNVVVSKFL
jgi:hypothetical protein